MDAFRPALLARGPTKMIILAVRRAGDGGGIESVFRRIKKIEVPVVRFGKVGNQAKWF
jgi:hypothetical protein